MELGLSLLGAGLGTFVSVLLITAILWSIFWKGWALWVAARTESRIWFIVLLIVNTFGILEILYIFVFSKRQPGDNLFNFKGFRKGGMKEAKVEQESSSASPEEPNA